MKTKYLFLALALLLVLPLADAKDLLPVDEKLILEKPDLVTLEPFQVTINDKLDSSYIVTEKEVLFKELKQIQPVVYIDKKVGTTYHVDALRDFVENETVTLKFYYDIQPDWIAHYKHSGEFDRYYFPTEWTWTPNCDGEICSGGWVTFEASNIDKGFGSNTYPIGITGPTWARQSLGYGVFDGVSSDIKTTSETSGQMNESGSFSLWLKYDYTDTTNQFPIPFQIGNSNPSRLQIVTFNSSGNVQFKLTNSTGNTTTPICFNSMDNTWHNYIGVYNKTYATIFEDGVICSTSYAGEINFTSVIYYIGEPSYAGSNYKGSIDEVLIYNRSLSQSEITALYNNYSVTSTGINRTGTPSTDGLVLDINFDDFSVADNSGNGNHGTNTNVTFGIVQEFYKTLTATTDYTVTSSGLFTIVNDDYLYSWLNASWVYITNVGNCEDSLNNVKEQFSLYVAGLISLFSIIGTMIGVIWISIYLKKLFDKKEGLESISA